jgi:hypothetical protein
LNTHTWKTFPVCGSNYAFVCVEQCRRGCGSSQAVKREHNKLVTQMNEIRPSVSAQVQRGIPNVAGMIEEPGHPAGHLQIL